MRSSAVFIMALLLGIVAFGCASGGDDDDDAGDDSTGDDDSSEDDAGDDAQPDDDASDDTDGDDSGDDAGDDADDDAGIAHSYQVTEEDITFTLIDGGLAGQSGVATAAGQNGEFLAAYVKSHLLVLYTWTDGLVTREGVAPFARSPSLAVDPNNYRHLAWYDGRTGSLRYRTDISGDWETQRLTPTGDPLDIRLAADAGGAAHIVYLAYGAPKEVRYATNVSGSWTDASVASGDIPYLDSTVDAGGAPHIAFVRYEADRCALVHAKRDGGAWASETVEELLLTDDRPYLAAVRIAVEASDIPHIGYLRAESLFSGDDDAEDGRSTYQSDLYHAVKPDAVWLSEAAAAGCWQIDSLGLGISSDGFVHMACGDVGAIYASNASGSWTSEATGAAGPLSVSLVVANDGMIHIAHRHEMDPNEIYQSILNGGVWSEMSVELGEYGGFGGTDMAVDSSRAAHVAYVMLDQDVRMGTNASGTWKVYAVEPAGSAKFLPDTAIAVEADGREHVAISASGYISPRHAVRSGSGWVFESISTHYYNPFSIAMTTGPADTFHMVFVDESDAVIYAAGVFGDWDLQTVAGLTYASDKPSDVALDGFGNAHLVFARPHDDPVYAGLQYATNAGGNWETENVLPSPSFHIHSASIALDGNGAAHVVACGQYGPGSTPRLDYATNRSGSWAVEELLADGDDVRYCSIDVDGNGDAHVTFKHDQHGMAYATNRTGSWVITVIDPAADIICSTAVAVDSGGIVQVAYESGEGMMHAAFPPGFEWEPVR